MENNPWWRALVVLLVFIAALYLAGILWTLLVQFADIITMLFLAWLLAFLLNPITKVGVSYRIPHAISVLLVYLSLLLAFVLAAIVAVPVITDQLTQLAQNWPTYADQLQGWVASLSAQLAKRNISIESLYDQNMLSQRLEQVGTIAAQNALAVATETATAIFRVMIILIFSVYMLLDGARMLERVITLVPNNRRDEVHYFLESVDRSFGGFLRGQLIQALIYGAGTAAVMALFGMNYTLIVSIFAGAMMLIPFLGPVLSIIPVIIIALLQLPFTSALLVIAILVGLQIVVMNVIAPKIMSDALGMHPLLVLLAVLVGTKVAGISGAFFGVPVVAVSNAMASYFFRNYRSRAKEQTTTETAGPPAPAPNPLPRWLSRVLSLFNSPRA